MRFEVDLEAGTVREVTLDGTVGAVIGPIEMPLMSEGVMSDETGAIVWTARLRR